MMDIERFLKDTFRDCDLFLDAEQLRENETYIAGIDEAGRGPVLGPMVYGIVYYPLRLKDSIEKSGFADSKALTEQKREDLFEAMCKEGLKSLGWITRVLSPVTISSSMLKRSKYNLNELSHDTAIALMNCVIDKNINVKEVYIDAVGPVDKYKSKLSNIFPNIKITVANKADSTYPVVSAASICAKVVRDRSINRWRFIENLDDLKIGKYGSGYPGDPDTKAFLQRVLDPVFGFPSFVRFSWATASKIIEEKCVECEWESEDEDDAPKNSRSIIDFCKPKQNEGFRNLASQFFTQRCLQRVNDLS